MARYLARNPGEGGPPPALLGGSRSLASKYGGSFRRGDAPPLSLDGAAVPRAPLGPHQVWSARRGPDPRAPERMMRWLEESGARITRATIERDRDGRRGLCARAEVPAGAALVEVPLRCIITTEVARASDVGQRIAASGIEPPSSQSVIAAFLLREKGRGRSFFAPYLDALPASYPDMPSSFGEAELALLRGSFTLAKIAQRRASLAREHQALCYHVRELRAFSPAEYVWARTAIMSRIFGIVVEGKKTEGLVPMADMCNHSTVRETSWAYHDDAGAFRTTALRPLRPGDPIFEHYGRKCNSRFFVNYGFTLDDNEDNEAVVALEIPAGDPLRDAKARILGDATRAFQVPARLDHEETRRMLSFLRVACAGPAELALLPRRGLSDARGVPALSPANEAAALDLLRASSVAALDRFETTVEEDDALLADPGLGPRARSCVVMRRGEKQVLHRFLDMAEEAIPLLRLPLEDLARAAAHREAGDDLDGHLAAVVADLATVGPPAAP